jgi:hypothetical protein
LLPEINSRTTISLKNVIVVSNILYFRPVVPCYLPDMLHIHIECLFSQLHGIIFKNSQTSDRVVYWLELVVANVWTVWGIGWNWL